MRNERIQHRPHPGKVHQDKVYKIYTPQVQSFPVLPLVFDSPHSGRHYPDDFDYACTFASLQAAEDNYVDDLFSCAPDYGAPLLCAQFPRTYIDVNRNAGDIDPLLIDESWPGQGGGTAPGAKAKTGYGLVRRLLRPETPLYARKLGIDEIHHRIKHYYTPYHAKLEELIGTAYEHFGEVWHINCHSMPSIPSFPSLPRGSFPLLHGQPDFVLGDRDGTSCDLDFTHSIRDFLKSLGYRVSVNSPYKGVEIVRKFGHPACNLHSIQLEINKALYWREHKNKKSRNYKNLKADLEKLVAFCADFTRQKNMAHRVAE